MWMCHCRCTCRRWWALGWSSRLWGFPGWPAGSWGGTTPRPRGWTLLQKPADTEKDTCHYLNYSRWIKIHRISEQMYKLIVNQRFVWNKASCNQNVDLGLKLWRKRWQAVYPPILPPSLQSRIHWGGFPHSQQNQKDKLKRKEKGTHLKTFLAACSFFFSFSVWISHQLSELFEQITFLQL